MQFPAPPEVIEYLLRRDAAPESTSGAFRNQIQLTIGAVVSGSGEEHNQVFRFQFARLDDDRWEHKLIVDKVVLSRARLILKRTDGAPSAFGGEFYLEPKYE